MIALLNQPSTRLRYVVVACVGLVGILQGLLSTNPKNKEAYEGCSSPAWPVGRDGFTARLERYLLSLPLQISWRWHITVALLLKSRDSRQPRLEVALNVLSREHHCYSGELDRQGLKVPSGVNALMTAGI